MWNMKSEFMWQGRQVEPYVLYIERFCTFVVIMVRSVVCGQCTYVKRRCWSQAEAPSSPLLTRVETRGDDGHTFNYGIVWARVFSVRAPPTSWFPPEVEMHYGLKIWGTLHQFPARNATRGKHGGGLFAFPRRQTITFRKLNSKPDVLNWPFISI